MDPIGLRFNKAHHQFAMQMKRAFGQPDDGLAYQSPAIFFQDVLNQPPPCERTHGWEYIEMRSRSNSNGDSITQ